MAIPQETVPVVTVTVTDPQTGVAHDEVWELPVGFAPVMSAAIDFVTSLAKIYAGGQTLDCPTPGTASPLNPVWTLTSLPVATASGPYAVSLYLNEVGTPATGQTIIGITAGNLPGWLAFSQSGVDGHINLLGNVPAGITSFDVTLNLMQSDGRSTPKTFTVSVSAVSFYAYLFCYADVRRIRPLIGGASTIPPKVQIVDGPAGFDGTQYTARPFVTVVGGTTYPFDFNGYVNMAFGEYALKIIHQGQTKFLKVIWTGAEVAQVVTLLDTQPSVNNGTGNGTPLPVAVTVTNVDCAYTAPSGSVLSTLYTYVKLSATSTYAEIAYEILNSAGNVVVPKSAYNGMSAYNDQTGYQFRSVLDNVGVKVRLYIRPASNPSAEVIVIFDRPTASVGRVTVYPPLTNTDLTTAYSFTGTTSGSGYRSTNPDLVNMAFDFAGGRITNLRNTATPSLASDEAMRYLINDQWFARSGSNWYRVASNGTVSSTAVALNFSPEVGVLIQGFKIKTSRPMNGSPGNPGWRDNPVENGSHLIRVL